MTSLPLPPERDRPGRLLRNVRRRLIGGVCAGIADYTGVPLIGVRIAAVVLLLVSMHWIGKRVRVHDPEAEAR